MPIIGHQKQMLFRSKSRFQTFLDPFWTKNKVRYSTLDLFYFFIFKSLIYYDECEVLATPLEVPCSMLEVQSVHPSEFTTGPHQ